LHDGLDADGNAIKDKCQQNHLKHELKGDIAVLVFLLEFRYFVSELALLLEFGEGGDVAEGVQDSPDDGVGERDYHDDEDGDIEMVGSIVIVSEILRTVGPRESVLKRHYINTTIAHVIIF